jgi:FMNH2-dependent dimethyl sulfone monooxygenase
VRSTRCPRTPLSSAKLIIFPLIVCKRTRAEALAYREQIVDHADWGSIEKFFARHQAGDGHGWKQHDAADRILGGHLQITGSPEDVADAIERLKEAGFDGVQLGFYDYAPDLEFFAENVLPLLKQRGLRL